MKPTNQEKEVPIRLRVPASVRDRLRVVAARKGLSMARLMRETAIAIAKGGKH